MRSVFNYFESVAPSDAYDSSHIRTTTSKMNRYDSFSSRSYSSLYLCCIYTRGGRVNIDKDGICTKIADNLSCSRRGVGSGYDFVTWTYAKRLKSKMQSSRSRVYRNAFDSTAKPSRKVCFKLLCLRTTGNPTRSK